MGKGMHGIANDAMIKYRAVGAILNIAENRQPHIQQINKINEIRISNALMVKHGSGVRLQN